MGGSASILSPINKLTSKLSPTEGNLTRCTSTNDTTLEQNLSSLHTNKNIFIGHLMDSIKESEEENKEEFLRQLVLDLDPLHDLSEEQIASMLTIFIDNLALPSSSVPLKCTCLQGIALLAEKKFIPLDYLWVTYRTIEYYTSDSNKIIQHYARRTAETIERFYHFQNNFSYSASSLQVNRNISNVSETISMKMKHV